MMGSFRGAPGDLFRGALLILLILFLLLLNRDVLRVRMQELDLLLSEAAREERTSPAELLGRYELIRNRIAAGESSVDNYRLEARLAVLRDSPAGEEAATEMAPVSAMGYATVSGVRAALGKPPLMRGGESPSLAEVQEAYLLERARQWSPAIQAYRVALARNDLPEDIRATVRLHIGFCYSMRSEFQSAREEYLAVSREFPDTEYDVVAQRLLVVVEELDQGSGEEAVGPVDEGRLAYLYMDYLRAIDVLENYLAGEGTREDEPEARYFKGRSHEELGEFRQAIGEYRRITFLGDDQWTREANRRLVMVGEFYSADGEIAREGRDALRELQDDRFLNAVRPYAIRAAAVPATEAPKPPETAELWIRSDPPGAAVEADGVFLGPSPAVLSGIAARTVELRLTHQGFETEIRRISVEPGRIHQIRMTLSPVVASATPEKGVLAAAIPKADSGVRPDSGTLPNPGSPSLEARLENLTHRLKHDEVLKDDALTAASRLATEARYGASERLAEGAARLQAAMSQRWSREESLRREIAGLEAQLSALPDYDSTAERRDERLKHLTWGSLGVGGAAALSFTTTLLLGNAAYAEYQAATTPEGARDARARTERFQSWTIGAGVLAGAALVAAGTAHLLRGVGRPASSQTEEERIRRRIEELRSDFGYRGELETQEVGISRR
mgnify:CR=1 FL=1